MIDLGDRDVEMGCVEDGMEESEMGEGGAVVLTMMVLGSLRSLEVLWRGEPWLRARGYNF